MTGIATFSATIDGSIPVTGVVNFEEGDDIEEKAKEATVENACELGEPITKDLVDVTDIEVRKEL